MIVQVPSNETIEFYLNKYVRPRIGKDLYSDSDSWNRYQQAIGWRDACDYYFGVSHMAEFIYAEDDVMEQEGGAPDATPNG